MGGKVIFMRPCIFRERFSIQNKQGGIKMTVPPTAKGTAAAMASLDIHASTRVPPQAD